MRPTDQLPASLLPPEPGGHLPVALLRQYVAGTLAPAAQHRVEAHTLDCQRCADVLEGLEMTDAATTDQSLTDLQSRLQARVAQEAAPQPATATWPWLQMAGVLLLLITSIVGWRLNQARTEAQSEPVAAVMRQEMAVAPQQPTVTPATPTPELEARESKSRPAEIAAADAVEPEAAREAAVAQSAASRAASSAPRATKRIQPQATKPADIDIAAIRTETFANKDKVLPDSVATSSSAAGAPTVAAAAPLPPDRAQTTTARTAAPAADATDNSGKQTAKMPPSADARTLASTSASPSSMRIVRGRITDQASGSGLPGVTVLVKGTRLGVSTQADGSFELPLPDSQSTLTIASIGYQTKEYKLSNPTAPLTLALAPDTKALSETVVVRKSKMPAPPSVGPAPAGGMPAFNEYLKKELEYPEEALKKHLEGNVKLTFTVSATGAIEDLKVVDGLSKECDEEAMRLVREGPTWFPGIIGGRRTAQQVRITVPFRL